MSYIDDPGSELENPGPDSDSTDGNGADNRPEGGTPTPVTAAAQLFRPAPGLLLREPFDKSVMFSCPSSLRRLFPPLPSYHMRPGRLSVAQSMAMYA